MFAAALLLVVAVSGDQFRRERWATKKPTFRTLAVKSLESTQPEYVFVGSSHIYTGIDPAVFSVPVINLSDACLNFECGEMMCRHFWHRVSNAKCVVLELDSVTVGLDTIHLRRGDLREFWQWGISGSDLPVSRWEQIKADVSRYSGATGSPGLTPASRKLAEQSASSDRMTQVIRPGFDGRVGSLDPARKEAFFANMGDWFEEETISANRTAAIRLIDDLNSRGVKVVLLRMPLHAEYWNHPISEKREVLVGRTWSGLMSRKGDEALPMIDLSRFEGLSDADFSDWTHLSVSGAEIVSKEIDRQLREIAF